jgi:hypothetical protein
MMSGRSWDRVRLSGIPESLKILRQITTLPIVHHGHDRASMPESEAGTTSRQ